MSKEMRIFNVTNLIQIKDRIIKGPSIQLVNGEYFYLRHIAESMQHVDIEVIAAGLSKICRFTGQTREFYSVAQHVCLCHDYAPPGEERNALFHDSSEVIIGDVSTPLKSILPAYKKLQNKLDSAFMEHFSYIETPTVKQLDGIALMTERRDLMPPTKEKWAVDVAPWPEPIEPWDPKRAEREFLDRALASENVRQLAA